MEKKLTYSQALATVIATLADGDVKDRLVALKESLDNRNANKKPTKVQKENEGIKKIILDNLSLDNGMTVTDLIKTVPELADLSNQKVTAILRLLGENGENKVEKKTDGKKTLFFLR